MARPDGFAPDQASANGIWRYGLRVIKWSGGSHMPGVCSCHLEQGAGRLLGGHGRTLDLLLTTKSRRLAVSVAPPQPSDQALRAERVYARRILFRAVNQQILQVAKSWLAEGELDFVCECGREACTEPVELAAADYEAVRRSPTRYIVRAGHVDLNGERVVETQADFLVVEPLGVPANVIRSDEHRHASSSSA